MNRKILTTALICLAYSPTPDLSSTFLQMGPVVMNMKGYLPHTDDVKTFERAAHNMQHNPIARQTVVFDFLIAFEKYNHTSTPTPEMQRNLKEKARKVNEQFSLNAGDKIYDELLEAIKRNIRDIIFITTNNRSGIFNKDVLKHISKLTPSILIGIFDTLHHILHNTPKSNKYYVTKAIMHEKNLIRIAKIIANMIAESKQSKIQEKASHVLGKALKQALSNNLNYYQYLKILEIATKEKQIEISNIVFCKISEYESEYDEIEYIYIAELAHQIESHECANRYLTISLEKETCSLSYNRASKLAHKMGKPEMAINILLQSHELANYFEDYIEIAKIAHELGHIELENRALNSALDNSNNIANCRDVAETAYELGNMECVIKALEKGSRFQGNYFYYIEITKIAHEIGNKALKDKLLTKAYQKAENCYDYSAILKLSHEVENIEYRNKALQQALKMTKNFRDYIYIASAGNAINSIKLENIALGKACNLAAKFDECIVIAKAAYEMNNILYGNKALDKAEELAQTQQEKDQITELSEEFSISPETEEGAPATAQE